MKDYAIKLRKLRELIEDIDEEFQNDTKATCDYATYLADRLLYSGVAPAVEGEWVYSEYGFPRCSKCGYGPDDVSPYCPNCGANMGEED